MDILSSIYLLLTQNKFSPSLPLWIFKLRNYAKINTSHNKECQMIHKYIYAGLAGLFLGLMLITFYFYKENKALHSQVVAYQQQIIELQYQLKQQNEAIERLALDTQEYKKQLTTQNKQWQKKYNTIVAKLDTTKATCEEQIANINEQLNAFMAGSV